MNYCQWYEGVTPDARLTPHGPRHATVPEAETWMATIPRDSADVGHVYQLHQVRRRVTVEETRALVLVEVSDD